MRWPWQRERAAVESAVAAESALAEARVNRQEAQDLAEEARVMLHTNGFTDAIRAAMGVK